MLLDLIYPPVCGICDKINKKNLCKKCELKIKKYEINKIEDYRNDNLKYFDYQIKVFRYENIILYVPMFKKHKLIRGYNQSELIARKISDTLGITLEKNNLTKVINTKKQSTLTKSERERNVKNAFKLKNPEKIKDKKVILFDDIYTTGSTVNECSKILKKAGATEIAILTIAVD